MDAALAHLVFVVVAVVQLQLALEPYLLLELVLACVLTLALHRAALWQYQHLSL
ncbi:hypothetical protein [Planktotalea sp.]|uniref:hypothetical protein n=1 Tax=Planktotalea sp. TaxID=2029877 RepID=UPI003F6B0304